MEIPKKLENSLSLQLDQFEKMNEYDYNEMLRSFRIEERKNNYKKDLIKPIKKQNLIWKQNLERYKEVKEELIEKQVEEVERKMLKKSDIINQKVKVNESSKQEEKQKRIEEYQQSKAKNKFNLQNFYDEQEKERLETQKELNLRLKLRSDRQADHINQIRQKFETKNKDSSTRFARSLNKIMEDQERLEREKKEEDFKRFENFYFNLIELKSKIKAKKNKQEWINQRNKELYAKMLEDHENQRLATQEKIENSEIRRIKLAKEKNKKIVQSIKENIQKQEQAKERREFLRLERVLEDRDLLRMQTEKISRIVEKEDAMEQKRSEHQ